MNSCTQDFLDQIVEDMNLLRKKMIWEADSYAMATISAFLFASANKRADIDRYVTCKKYLKKHVNLFSEIRGIAEAIVITKMCLSDNYEEYLTGVVDTYKKLRKIHKLTASAYMVMAAVNIYEGGGIARADENIEKLEAVYKEMKADHFWLTGDEDRPFLAMMVSRNLDVNSISTDISECYEACKRMSLSKESMHTASQIMSLSGKSVDVKVADLDATVTALKKHRLKGMRYELMPVAAALGMIEGDPDRKAADIRENYDYLKTKKGFKWYIGGKQRSLYAILAYALEHLDGDKAVLNSVISTTITNIIIQQIILLIILTSTSNSSSSSGSSGSN